MHRMSDVRSDETPFPDDIIIEGTFTDQEAAAWQYLIEELT